MSKDIIVLTPNGRRQKIHCTPDTIILQVLEDVCQKQGFQAIDYDLKHHNHILDLTTTIRFSNLPNKATLEMVETERRKREETIVTIGLMLEDGERRTADFPPSTSLYELVTALAPGELKTLSQPTILYMRQEVVGESALKEKTLRQLGLMGGRAILRLLNKAEEAKQANVSTVYRRPVPEKKDSDNFKETPSPEDQQLQSNVDETSTAGPSNANKHDKTIVDPIKFLKDVQASKKFQKTEESKEVTGDKSDENVPTDSKEPKVPTGQILGSKSSSSTNMSVSSQEHLERRLNIEEEVTFLGTQKAIAFMQPDEIQEELDDLPDDFYELTIEEVRKLYHDLQQNRLQLENTPLITSAQKESLQKQTSQQRLSGYKNVVVRVQFPDHIILQGVFLPTDTVQDIINFIKSHLQNPEKPFHIFTTPLKETLDPTLTLIEAKFVPCVHMHFKWLEEEETSKYLKEEVYSKKTSSDAASILASKYRAPSRRKIEDGGESSKNMANISSSSKNSKLPKWFKK